MVLGSDIVSFTSRFGALLCTRVQERLRVIPRMLLPAVALFLAGCADFRDLRELRLYSATRDAQGQAAVKAWAEANPRAVIQSSLDNYSALLGEQLISSREGRMASADNRLMALAVQDNGRSIKVGLLNPIDEGLLKLVGSDQATSFKALKAARMDAILFNDAVDRSFLSLQQHGAEVSSCAELQEDSPQRKALDAWLTALKLRRLEAGQSAEQVLADASSKCLQSAKETGGVNVLLDKAQADAKAPAAPPMPSLYAAMVALRSLEQQLTKNKMEHVAERNEYRAARLNFERILREAPPQAATPAASGASAASNGTTLTEAISTLQDSFKKLKDLNDKYSMKLFSEARIAAIDDLFITLLSPKAANDPNATAKDRAVQALNTLLTTEENWKLSQEEAREILARPLQAQQQVDALQVAALGRSIAADEARLALLKERVAVQTKMASHFTDAHGFLNPVTSKNDPKPNPLSHPERNLAASLYGGEDAGKKFEKVGADERRRLIQGAGHFLYVSGDLTADLDAVVYKEDALNYANQLTISENHVRQWEVLVGSNIDLLSTWAAHGVKEETISRGVNALLLFWIGLGVN